MNKTYGYVYKPTDFAQKHLIYALGMGYTATDNPFLIDRGNFPGYLFMSCCSGKLHIEQYGKSVILVPGQCCLMTLQDPHKYYSDTKDLCEMYWLHFDGKQVGELFSLIQQKAASFIVFQEQVILSSIYRCITNYQPYNTGSSIELSSNVYRILLMILKGIMENDAADSVSPLILQLEPFLAEHINEKITLEMMAEKCHLDPAYFCRRFRSETNKTPMQYLMEKKVEIAQYYLLHTNEKISAIAEALGFYDQNHFSFRYKKATGLSPSEYRKRNT